MARLEQSKCFDAGSRASAQLQKQLDKLAADLLADRARLKAGTAGNDHSEKAAWSLCLLEWQRLEPDTQQHLCRAAAAERHFWEGRQHRRDNQGFAVWLDQALQGGAGAAHRITKGTKEIKPVAPAEASKALATERKAWAGHWCRDADQLAATRGRLDGIRQSMWAEPLDDQLKLHPARLRKVISATKDNAGKGPDGVDRRLALRLPSQGWTALTQIMQAILCLGILPLQMTHSWIALLQKPLGGWRPIALLCMTYRWLLRSHRPTASSWDRDNAPPWDFSAPGRGADQACFEEELAAELDVLEGKHLAGCLMDLAKFYDGIDINIMISAAVAMDFPKQLLVLGLDACLGIRQIMMSDQLADTIASATGLLPGCVLATSFARAFMIPLLSRLKSQMEDLTLRVYVDDVKLRRAGDTATEAAQKGATAIGQAAVLFEMARCTVSDKTTLMASNAATAKELVQRLQLAGYNWTWAKQAKDLGVDTSFGARRVTKIRQERFGNALRRAKSVAGLVKQNKVARKLIRPGLSAGMKWGLPSHGASELRLQKMRRTMLTGAAINKHACAITAFRLHWPNRSDPTIAEPVRLFKKWYRTMARVPPLAAQAARVWKSKAFARFAARQLKAKWIAVKGPATAIYTTMQEMQWNMTSPSKFRDHNDEEWEAGGEDLGALAEQAAQRLEAKQWQWASSGRNGGGLQQGGADLTIPQKARAAALPQDRGLLEAIFLGTLWFPQRVADSFGGPGACARCGATECTDLHANWQCPGNASVPEAIATQHLQETAIRQCTQQQPRTAYWLRGLLANDEVSIPPPPPVPELALHNGMSAEHTFQGDVGTDGSGGGEQMARLRRCSWAAVQIPAAGWTPSKKHYRIAEKSKPRREVSHRQWPAVAAMLHSPQQTVARAELFAVCYVIQRQGGPLHIWSDHLPLVKVWDRISKRGLGLHEDLANADLWDDILAARELNAHWPLQISWVNSHAEAELDLSPGLDGRIDRGNDAADYWAIEEAATGQVNGWYKERLEEAHTEQQMVIDRLLAIAKIAIVPEPKEDKKQRKKAAAERPGSQQRYAEALMIRLSLCKHTLTAAGGGWLCTTCLARSPRRGKPLLEFLRTSCSTTGLQRPHHSHKCRAKGQVVWCMQCGAWSSARYRGLADTCNERPATALQRLALRRLDKGLAPPGIDYHCMNTICTPRLFQELEVVEEPQPGGAQRSTDQSLWSSHPEQHNADPIPPPRPCAFQEAARAQETHEGIQVLASLARSRGYQAFARAAGGGAEIAEECANSANHMQTCCNHELMEQIAADEARRLQAGAAASSSTSPAGDSTSHSVEGHRAV